MTNFDLGPKDIPTTQDFTSTTTTFARPCVAYVVGGIVSAGTLIIQQIVTLSKYGHDALDICHP